MIPARYEFIQDQVPVLCTFDKKRLSSYERKSLEIYLLKYNLRESDKFVFELVRDCEYKDVIKIQRRDGIKEYRAQFEGAPEVWVSSEVALILNGGEFNKTINMF